MSGTGILLYMCTLFSCFSVVLSGRLACFLCQGTYPLSRMNYPKYLRHFNISCQTHKTSLTSAGNESDVLWQSQAGQQRESLNVSRSEKDLNVPLPERTGCVSKSDSPDFCIQECVNVETDVPSFINTGFLWKELFICGPCLTIRSKIVLFCDKEQGRNLYCLHFF